MDSINYSKDTTVNFKAEYTEAKTKSMHRFKVLCLSNPVGWVVGGLYAINKLFKKAILSLSASPLFGTAEERKTRDSIALEKLTNVHNGKEIVLETPDGRMLEAMHFEGTSNKTVILFTGSHQSFEHQAPPMVAAYKKQGFNVLCINYGGFGKSEGSPTQEGIELDAETAYQYIQKQYPDNEIHAHGYSLGSYPATFLAKNHPLKKVVVDRGFSNFSNVAKDEATKKAGAIGGYIFKGIVNYALPLDNTQGIANISSDLLFARAEWDDIMLKHHENAFKEHLPSSKYLSVEEFHQHDSHYVWFQHNKDFWDWMHKPISSEGGK